MLKDTDLKHVIYLSDMELDLFLIFGETEDQIHDWLHATKLRIKDLLIRASNKVSERKAAIQTGIRKLSYLHFMTISAMST